jgi:hypothetical protein
VAWLFGDEEGRAAAGRMDDTIAELPGLGGIHVFRDALAATIDRVGTVHGRARAVTPLAAFRT